MTEFTPGPWTAAPYSSVVGCPITAQPDPKKNTIVVAGTRDAMAENDADFRAEVEANAALIAAAPELYEQVELFVRCVEFEIKVSLGKGDDEGARLKSFTLHRARGALAKARGEAA